MTQNFHSQQQTDVKQVLASLEASQWKSVDEIRDKQLQRLNTILKHAYETVPYYRQMLSEYHYLPKNGFTWEMFYKLPILARTTVRNHTTEFHSSDLTQDKYTYSLSTSGSTGVGVNITATYECQVYWRALALRDHLWHQRDFKKTLAAIRWSPRGIGMPPFGDVFPHWGNVTEGIYQTGPSVFLNVNSDTLSQMFWLQKNNPGYLMSYPSQLKALAEYSLENNIPLENLHQVRSIGETVSSTLRTLCKEAWGATLTDVYSAEEFGYLAIQCPDHEHYHIQSENVIVEVLNDTLAPCEPGETGKVFVTGLHNLAMPLIRYDIGDFATVGKRCDCGRDALPILSKIDGRTRNRLHYPNKPSCFPYLGEREDYIKILPKIQRFQFIQHDLNTIEFKLATQERMSPERERACQTLIQKNFGHLFTINITYHTEIPSQPNGKFEEFISLATSGDVHCRN